LQRPSGGEEPLRQPGVAVIEGDVHRADNILQILQFPAATPYPVSCSTTEKEVVECLIVTCR
jgi:hypothetical protein